MLVFHQFVGIAVKNGQGHPAPVGGQYLACGVEDSHTIRAFAHEPLARGRVDHHAERLLVRAREGRAVQRAVDHAGPGGGKHTIPGSRRAGMLGRERTVKLRQFLRPEGAIRLKAAGTADYAPFRPVAHGRPALVLEIVRFEPRIEMVIRTRRNAFDPSVTIEQQPVDLAAQDELAAHLKIAFAQGSQ